MQYAILHIAYYIFVYTRSRPFQTLY